MSDIVERARGYIPCSAENILMNDLADEIERLRREIATLRNYLGGIKNNVDLALGDYGQPTDEIERLREANARLAKDLAMKAVDHG